MNKSILMTQMPAEKLFNEYIFSNSGMIFGRFGCFEENLWLKA
jgi:hypothetical protein